MHLAHEDVSTRAQKGRVPALEALADFTTVEITLDDRVVTQLGKVI